MYDPPGFADLNLSDFDKILNGNPHLMMELFHGISYTTVPYIFDEVNYSI